MRLSFVISSVSGLILVLLMLNFIICTYPDMLQRFKFGQNTILVLLLTSIALGIHAISHANEEIYYDYNPLKDGKLIPSDEKKLDK